MAGGGGGGGGQAEVCLQGKVEGVLKGSERPEAVSLNPNPNSPPYNPMYVALLSLIHKP